MYQLLRLEVLYHGYYKVSRHAVPTLLAACNKRSLALYVMHLLSTAASQDGCRLLSLPCRTIQGPCELAGRLLHTLPAKPAQESRKTLSSALSQNSR